MSSESDYDFSDRSQDSIGSEGNPEDSSDEEEEEEEELIEEDRASRPIIYVGRGVEFPNPPEGALVVEEDRPEGFHLDEYVFTNVVAYMMDLVNSGELLVRRMGTRIFIEVTRTKRSDDFLITSQEETVSTAGGGASSSSEELPMNMTTIFRKFILEDGGNRLAERGLIIWVSYAVPGKPSHKRMFMLSELSLEAMRARW